MDAGIDSFIDLTEEDELGPYLPLLQQRARQRSLQLSYRRFPIPDLGLPAHAQMLAILDHIDEALAAGKHIYLHCWGGIGRTGTTVGCYLVRHGMSAQEALDQISDWWQDVTGRRSIPLSPETPEQTAFVRGWDEAAPAAPS
ncbi:MAG TPA: protein-tyrosine phosphatase family protein [Anaerolineales bacterium]|nr:protein-tyrosine phosphatase family protein [Anaerolineales bacterium]